MLLFPVVMDAVFHMKRRVLSYPKVVLPGLVEIGPAVLKKNVKMCSIVYRQTESQTTDTRRSGKKAPSPS